MKLEKLLATAGMGAMAMVLASACTVDTEGGLPEEVANAEEPLCNNKGGINAVRAALATAAGKEMRRWLPTRDFQWNYSQGVLELSPHAAPRCPNRQCTNTLAILAMQRWEAHNNVTFPGNIKLDVGMLRSALKSDWDRQIAYANSNPLEAHDLVYTHTENGSCDKKFFFNPHVMGSSARLPNPERLANHLIFAGYPDNRMLNFYVRNGQVSIDPTVGLNPGVTATSGSCTAACSKFEYYNVSGSCCVCNGKNGRFAQSAFSPYFFQCK